MDRLLDEAHSGHCYLRQPAIAGMVVEAIQYNAANLEHYVLHAFVVMRSTARRHSRESIAFMSRTPHS